MDSINKFIGTGISFPIILQGGKPVISSGSELISSSIKIILSWTVGTRLMNSSFGSLVDDLIEEPNDSFIRGLLEELIFDSLSTFEKRITVLDINVSKIENEKLEVFVLYRIKGSRIEDSLTFPYYKTLSN
jgi:phage baseplate assembly protein W